MAKRKSKAQRIRISYNAPVTLTFSLIAAAILIINQFVLPGIIALIFTVPGKIGSEFAFDWKNTFDYVRLFTHVNGYSIISAYFPYKRIDQKQIKQYSKYAYCDRYRAACANRCHRQHQSKYRNNDLCQQHLDHTV